MTTKICMTCKAELPEECFSSTGIRLRRDCVCCRATKSVIRTHTTNLVHQGVIEKPLSCSVCLRDNVKIEAHHNDYRSATNISWLCTTCHGQEHRATRNLARLDPRIVIPKDLTDED